MSVLAIDPGPTDSQFVLWDGKRVLEKGHVPNPEMRAVITRLCVGLDSPSVCIEMIASYGLAVGREVFETCVWIGRFEERCWQYKIPCKRIVRMEVKLHLCHSVRAKDANIRQALIDRFGGKDAAIGRKANPGPLYGVSSHAWAALALAITFSDTASQSVPHTQTAKTA